MKSLTRNTILALAAVLAAAADRADAMPFSVTVTSELSAVSDDLYDLDGATLEIVYSADTTDAATKSLDNGERIRQFFNAFTQTVSFTNRPNGGGGMSA